MVAKTAVVLFGPYSRPRATLSFVTAPPVEDHRVNS